jgi:uncharacterized protein YjiS (DUF1127 family)
MSAQYPVIPVAGGALLRAFAYLMSTMTAGAKRLARARRHRRDAVALAQFDRHMLADIGISRSDLRDAFSEPFWEDPTALLRERALERRWNSALMRDDAARSYRRPRTDRPARHTV